MSVRKNKTGIIGGTFNPIHIGHLILAENACSKLSLDRVVFMPTGISYLKDINTILPAEDRLKLVRAAVAGNDHFTVSEYETSRQGNTYTSETLSELNAMYPEDEFYFIIGEDSIYNIETWHDPQTIFDNCVLVVAPRGHVADVKLINIRDHLKEKYNASIVLLDTPDIDISSSMIRERVFNGESIRYYVPETVREMIISENYYR